MTLKSLLLHDYDKHCSINNSSQLNFDHLELFYYIYSVEVVASCDLYERYLASKQTIRSRLRVLEKCFLIKRLEKINLGGNKNSNFFCCTRRGLDLIKKWPFRKSISTISSEIMCSIPIVERESSINIAQLSTLISLSDLSVDSEGSVYLSDIVDLFTFESESTVQRRILYLKKKKLIAVKRKDQRRLGISSVLEYTDQGACISHQFSN